MTTKSLDQSPGSGSSVIRVIIPSPMMNDKETMVTASETSGNSASKHFDTRHPLWWCYHRGSQPYTELDHRDEFSRIRQKIDIITQMFSIFRFSAKCVFFSSVFQLMNRDPLLTNRLSDSGLSVQRWWRKGFYVAFKYLLAHSTTGVWSSIHWTCNQLLPLTAPCLSSAEKKNLKGSESSIVTHPGSISTLDIA